MIVLAFFGQNMQVALKPYPQQSLLLLLDLQ